MEFVLVFPIFIGLYPGFCIFPPQLPHAPAHCCAAAPPHAPAHLPGARPTRHPRATARPVPCRARGGARRRAPEGTKRICWSNERSCRPLGSMCFQKYSLALDQDVLSYGNSPMRKMMNIEFVKIALSKTKVECEGFLAGVRVWSDRRWGFGK